MSHELRTPLNGILGFSELMLRYQDTSDARPIKHLQAIRRGGQHLLNLINDILDLSKIEAGKFELDLQTISIQTLCRECLSMIQPRADRKRLLLSLEVDYRIDQVSLDARRVQQMIINLLSNAVKFTPEQGQIRLSMLLAYGSQLLEDFRPDASTVNASTPYLCISVEDTGIGIPDDKKHLLFQPFQQIDSSLTRRHDGTGLGLALTRRLAEMHGGTVSLRARTDQGSTFRIWLPLNEHRQTAVPAGRSINHTVSPSANTQSSTLFTPTVLVVEDQPYNQALITEVLELEGFAVELISDGQVMMDTIQSGLTTEKSRPGLMLMDIQLPNVDGLQLIRTLKLHPSWKMVPIIAVTAMAMVGDRDRCLKMGADDYIAKPIDIRLLVQKVRSLMSLEGSEISAS
jgi:CheY-like chemotaxis protein